MNTYKPVSARAVALYGPETVELDLSATEEADALSGGHLEVVPRPYKILVDNFEAGEQDSTADLALRVDQEAALVDGGILERVEAPAKKKPAKKPTSK